MDKVHLSGGRSFGNGVAFATNRHIATATLANDVISVKVRKLSGSVLRWAGFKKWFRITPQLLAILVSALIGTEKVRNRLLVVGILACICFILSFHVNSLLLAGTMSALLIGCTIMLVAMHDKYKPFHAAEHKAFNAYVNHGSTELETIAKQDRINPICGTSVIAPFALVLSASPFLAFYSQLNFILSSAILLEVTLWVDSLIGWHRVPVFKDINRWLQLRYTTSEPTIRQLEVAKTALDAVIAAQDREV